MNSFRRQQLQGILTPLLTAVLLIVSLGFSIISYAASEGARLQQEAIDSRYLTIGTFQEQGAQKIREEGWIRSGVGYQWENSNYEKFEDGSIQWEDGSWFYSSAALEAIANNSPQLLNVKRNAILSAHTKGHYALSSGEQNELQYNVAFDNFGANFCVLAVHSIEPLTPSMINKTITYTVFDNEEEKRIRNHPASFAINEIVSAHPYYAERLNYIFSHKTNSFLLEDDITTYFTETGVLAFQDGKNYLIRGFFEDYPIIQRREAAQNEIESYHTTFVYRRYDPDHSDDFFLYQLRSLQSRTFKPTTTDLYSLEDLCEQEGTGVENFTVDIGMYDQYPMLNGGEEYYYVLPTDGLPYYAEYTGTLEEFLASEEGRVWREEIIPMAELNQQSATVILTDNLELIHSFNSGEATILDGREISALEYERGRPVCLISAAYAEVNDLQVGDTIDLDFYDTGYFLTTGGVENFEGTTSEFVMTHNPLQKSNRIGFAQTYEIIGIYAAPEFEFGLQSFRADTIFVPKASVPRAENYEDPALPLLNSVVLLNGSEEAFEAYMAEQGFGGYYEYFNQDYTSTIAGLEAMELNAQRLILIGIIVVIVTAIFFYYLNMRRMIPVARTLRKLGQSRLHIWWQIQWTIQPLILLSVLAAAWLSMKLYDQVTLELLKSTVLLEQDAVRRIAKIAAAVLCLPPILIAIPISLPKLMKRK